ncbi:MAG TPA: cytochrome c maturation protein CcmE [bacterium]|nr:cytochrome c maturation protein CcmE [bacterium]
MNPAHPPRAAGPLRARGRRTAVFATGTVAIVLSLAYLVYGGIQQGATYWVTVGELRQRAQALPPRVRLGGTVAAGTVRWDAGHRHLAFVITDGANTLPVRYTGVVPDIFAEGRQVVVEGGIARDGAFEATTLLAKCPTKYNPADPKPPR